mgnify:CR=1 FL=1
MAGPQAVSIAATSPRPSSMIACSRILNFWILPVTVVGNALRLRAILLEFERLYNHVTDIGALCNDVGHSILNAHAGRIREQLLRINDQVTGHRLLRGALHPGGACLRRLPDPAALQAHFQTPHMGVWRQALAGQVRDRDIKLYEAGDGESF